MYAQSLLELVATIGGIQDINELRSTLLTLLRPLVWFDGANFWLNDPVTGLPLGLPVTSDIVPQSLVEYMTFFLGQDDFHNTYSNSGLLIARSTDILVYSHWTRHSEYYNDFLRLYRTHYMLSFDLRDGGRILGGLCLHRDKSTGDFSLRDKDVLANLYPHLVNSFRWYHALRSLSGKSLTYPKAPNTVLSTLTTREQEIVKRIMSGSSNATIAKELHLSVNTIKMHLQNIYGKLKVKNRTQLVGLYLALSGHGLEKTET